MTLLLAHAIPSSLFFSRLSACSYKPVTQVCGWAENKHASSNALRLISRIFYSSSPSYSHPNPTNAASAPLLSILLRSNSTHQLLLISASLEPLLEQHFYTKICARTSTVYAQPRSSLLFETKHPIQWSLQFPCAEFRWITINP